MPEIRRRYRTTDETAIVGESLAGLFIIETLLVEPSLFNSYIAFDPSLWWDNERLVNTAAGQLRSNARRPVNVYVASSGEPTIAPAVRRLADSLRVGTLDGVTLQYTAMPEETHGTIYHPAALRAFRALFKPSRGQSDSLRWQ
jgi:predicted alpha/beta superfamily hydrolase